MAIEIPVSEQSVSITTLGTCRIADSIAASVKSRPLRKENANVYGFAHTAKEILQQVDYLEGTKAFPPELAPFISADGAFTRAERSTPDVFIIEISTLKEIIFDSWYLQINYLERALRGNRGVFDAFSRLKSERDPGVRLAFLDAVPAFADVGALERRILVEGYVRSATREELDADMATIVERLRAPVLFVNHINVAGMEGTLIETRSMLCGWIQDICRDRGFRHFDPTPHVQEYGRDQALADRGRDLNHYTADFKPVMGDIIFDTMFPGRNRPPRRTSRKTPAPTAPVAPQPDAGPASPGHPPGTLPVVTPGQLQLATKEAKKRIADGDLDEAEAILHALAIEDHRCALVHTLLGTVSFHRGDTAAAIAQFREAVALDAHVLEPRVMLVKSALRMAKLDEACSMAADLVRRAPDDIRILLVASKAMMRARRFTDAAGIWRRMGYLRPELVTPHIEIARCELKSRNYEAALAAADEALEREPREPSALVIKSDALQKLRRMKELAEVAVELATIDPAAAMAAVPALISAHHPEEAAKIVGCASRNGEVDIDAVMRAGLIRMLERRGKVAEERADGSSAAAAWKAILLIDPNSGRAAIGLRRLLSPIVAKAREAAGLDNFDESARLYHSALTIQEDNLRLLRELAIVHERARDWVAASTCWFQLSKLTERSDHAMRAARLATRAERYDLAVPIYSSLERDEPTDRVFVSVTRKLVRSMRNDFDAGHLEAAASKASVVLQAEPGSDAGQRVVRKVMGTYSRRLRDAISSQDGTLQEEIGRKMLAIEPGRKDALKVLAKLYRVTKRHRDGIEVLQRLTEIEPQDTRNWIKLARTCRAIRLYDRGVPAALKALEIEPGDLDTVSLLSDMLNRQAAAA